MPELPEVEVTRQQLLQSQIIGKKICRVDVFWEKTVGGSAKIFTETLIGTSVQEITRKGKLLIFHLSSGLYMTTHLRMSGRFSLRNKDGSLQKSDRVIFFFEGNHALYFQDSRKFGRMEIVCDLSLRLQKIGVDPLSKEYTLHHFIDSLSSKKTIKSLLLDQSIISGIGNIYADELLFLTGIHPQEVCSCITNEKKNDLFIKLPQVLQESIRRSGTSLGKGEGNFHSVNGNVGKFGEMLHVYGRDGLPCKTCKTPIQRITLQSRSTHFCPLCQKKTSEKC